MMKAFRHSKVRGLFSKVYAGIRLSEDTHEYAKAFTDKISGNPQDITNWIVLADKLEEENNIACHMIRLIFNPDHVAPKEFTGSIYRSFRYFNNGQMCWEDTNISYENGNFSYIYVGDGSFRVYCTREEAIQQIIRKGTDKGNFCNLTIQAELPPTAGHINTGTVVNVIKPDGKEVKGYKVKQIVPVSIDAKSGCDDTVVFEYEGHKIFAKIKDVVLTV